MTKTKPRHDMTDRDRDILRQIHYNRFLTSDLISIIFGMSKVVTNRRLKKLTDNGYVIKLNEDERNKTDIVALKDKAYDGKEGLNLHFGIEKPTARMTEKNRSVKYDIFVDHHLLIAKIRITLTLALRVRKDASLSEWIPDKERINKYFISENGREVPRTFAPDSFITITLEDEDYFEDKYFFLEADRGTKDNDRFLQQMEKYELYRSAWKEEMGIDENGEHFGFRVLVVVLTDEKVNNLRKKMREADNSGLGTRQYLFTSTTRFNPEEPETILQRIWQTPNDDTFHSLLE